MMYHFPIGYDNHHPSQIERRDFLFLGQGEPTWQDQAARRSELRRDWGARVLVLPKRRCHCLVPPWEDP